MLLDSRHLDYLICVSLCWLLKVKKLGRYLLFFCFPCRVCLNLIKDCVLWQTMFHMVIEEGLFLKFLSSIMCHCLGQRGLSKWLILTRYKDAEWCDCISNHDLRISIAEKDFLIIQVRPGSSAISSGTPEKSQLSRTELWTKDIIDYLQYLLDEVIKNSSHFNPQFKDRSPKVVYSDSTHQKGESASSTVDGEEPSLHFKWWYVVRLLQWHNAEGLLLPSLIIEWVLSQLQVSCVFLEVILLKGMLDLVILMLNVCVCAFSG